MHRHITIICDLYLIHVDVDHVSDDDDLNDYIELLDVGGHFNIIYDEIITENNVFTYCKTTIRCCN